MKRIRSLLCAVAVLALCGAASAANLTFDELGTDPVPADGVTVSPFTFGFTVGGVGNATDAYYNLYDFGWNSMNVQGAALEGTTAGVLSVSFAAPVRDLGFDVALDTIGPVTAGATVSLFDWGWNLLETRSVDLDSLFPDAFAEAHFAYSGAPLGGFDLSFNPQAGAGIFALDNLNAVPEPSTCILLGSGLAGLVLVVRKRRGTGPV